MTPLIFSPLSWGGEIGRGEYFGGCSFSFTFIENCTFQKLFSHRGHSAAKPQLKTIFHRGHRDHRDIGLKKCKKSLIPEKYKQNFSQKS